MESIIKPNLTLRYIYIYMARLLKRGPAKFCELGGFGAPRLKLSIFVNIRVST